MPCSAARLEANRRNAQKSTGPRTPEGKAASSRNATRHGWAASGDTLGPADDPASVAARADALAEELGATGEAGRTLARRAAILAGRMERLAERDEAETHARMARAVAEADAPRARVLDRLIAELHHVGPQRPLALRTLEQSPDGVDRLLAFAEGIVAGLDLGGEPALAARRRALGWIDPAAPEGSEPGPEAGSPTDEDARAWVLAEMARLEDRALDLAPERERLDRERHRVALQAAFDPGPEAQQARRYEAAAERGFFRALQAIRQLRRDAEARPDDADPAPSPVEPTPAPSPADLAIAADPDADAEPADAEPADVAAPDRPLGSFGAGGPARLDLDGSAPMASVEVADRRRRRPDPLRLVAGAR